MSKAVDAGLTTTRAAFRRAAAAAQRWWSRRRGRGSQWSTLPVIDLPAMQVVRGGLAFGSTTASEVPSAAQPADTGTIVSSGWCAPSHYLSTALISPEINAQAEYDTRPCGGEHRWERRVDSHGCGCSMCAGVRRYVECAGCSAVVREGEPGFDSRWEVAQWL